MGATLSDLAQRLKPRYPDRALPRLVLMSDSHRLPDPLAAAELLPRGSALVLRHYGTCRREELARKLVRLCRARGLVFLIAGDAVLAVRVGADGVHWPEYQARRMSGCGRWRRPRRGFLVTTSAHSAAAIQRARRLGADAALLSPVFPTPSHPGGRALGVLAFTRLCLRAPLPVYALGGLGPTTARRVLAARPAGFAGIGGFVPSDMG